MAPYHVTKHAVVALSENLHLSLAQQNARVKVSVLCPGWVNTRIMSSAENRPLSLQDEPAPVSPEVQAALEAFGAAVQAGMSPREVAGHVFAAIREDRFYILTHPEALPIVRERMENILHGHNPHLPF